MEELAFTGLAALVGVFMAVQTSMLGAIGERRGAAESAWVSVVATAAGVAVALAVQEAVGESIKLRAPGDSLVLILAIAVVMTFVLIVSMRGIDRRLGLVGFLGLFFMLVVPIIIDEVGVALTVAVLTAASLLGALGLDHVGAFEIAARRITARRVAGAAMLIAGVALIQVG